MTLLSATSQDRWQTVLDLFDDYQEPRHLEAHQLPPDEPWFGWLFLAGRGTGKTEADAYFVNDHANGPACLRGAVPHRIGIVAPTLGDAVTACVDGPSGLRAYDPNLRARLEPGGLIVRWFNGAEAKLFGAHTPEDVERLRAGGNRCLYWFEELAAWRHLQDGFDQALFGLRSGPNPRWVASTTPKTRPLIKETVNEAAQADPDDPLAVKITRGTTADNPHLPEHIRRRLFDRYGGRQIGRQELQGELIDEDEGALWKRAWIDRGRVVSPPGMYRITIAIDPSGGAGEQGIVAVGKGVDAHGYILGDRSCCLSPEGWGRRAVQAWLDFEADDIVGEINYGGDMVVSVVRTAAVNMAAELRARAEMTEDPDLVRELEIEARKVESVPVRRTTATRGKRVRAEPVSAMYEVDPARAHHVGVHEELEDQMCTWTPESGYSPDRLDAMVWGFWHLNLLGQGTGHFGGTKMARRKVA